MGKPLFPPTSNYLDMCNKHEGGGKTLSYKLAVASMFLNI